MYVCVSNSDKIVLDCIAVHPGEFVSSECKYSYSFDTHVGLICIVFEQSVMTDDCALHAHCRLVRKVVGFNESF